MSSHSLACCARDIPRLALQGARLEVFLVTAAWKVGCLKWTRYWEVGALSDHLTCELGALRGAEEEGAHVGGARSSYGPVQYSR